MPVRKYKPTTPSRRSRVDLVKDDITKFKPQKSLTRPLKKNAGRSRGTITVRHRGGGHKRMYRIIDFKRNDMLSQPATVLAIEYDPNRSANLALVQYPNGRKSYILAPVGLGVGQEVVAGEQVKVTPGNATSLKNLPLGTFVHNVELTPGKGAQMARAAGQSALLQAKEGGFVQLKLSSGEIRLVPENCFATVGQVGNVDHHLIVLGKAGRSRQLGRRPKVRGTAMAAGDHPHGGGEGRTGEGRTPRTYKGKIFRGVPTRNKKKASSKYIVQRRGGGRR